MQGTQQSAVSVRLWVCGLHGRLGEIFEHFWPPQRSAGDSTISVFHLYVCMFVHLLTASDWLKYTHNLLDSLLQDDTAGTSLRGAFFGLA